MLSNIIVRDWFEDELRAFEGGKTGVLPCVWENETPIFPQVRYLDFKNIKLGLLLSCFYFLVLISLKEYSSFGFLPA